MIEIRAAKDSDIPQVKELFGDLTRETWDEGGNIRPNERSISTLESIIDAIHSDKSLGVVAVAVDDWEQKPNSQWVVGVLVWGNLEPEETFSFREGRLAFGYGTYVHKKYRGKGISAKLRVFGRERLIDQGFNAVIGSVNPKNVAGLESVLSLGFVEYDKTYILRFNQ